MVLFCLSLIKIFVGFWVYIIGPFLGAPLGGFLYSSIFGIHFQEQNNSEDNSVELRTPCVPVGTINFTHERKEGEETQCLILRETSCNEH